jgi:hypothetical protein
LLGNVAVKAIRRSEVVTVSFGILGIVVGLSVVLVAHNIVMRHTGTVVSAEGVKVYERSSAVTVVNLILGAAILVFSALFVVGALGS